MDLAELHIFRCIVREGGITRAAEKLHRVPSNITTRMKQLEQRLGVSLFRKQGRILVLTDAGKILLPHAEKLLHLADIAEQELRSGILKGSLRLGSLESAAGARLPPILSAFHALYPEVLIELHTGTSGTLLRRLANYEIEAAFVSEPFEAQGCSSYPAFEEELILITAKGIQSPVRPSDLRGQTLVAFPHGCSYRRRLIEWLAEDGISAGRILELSSYHAIVACVSAGTGAAIVPAEILDNAIMSESIARHILPKPLCINKTHLVWLGEASPTLQLLFPMLPKPVP